MRFYSLILGISIIFTTQASELDAQSSGYFPIGVVKATAVGGTGEP